MNTSNIEVVVDKFNVGPAGHVRGEAGIFGSPYAATGSASPSPGGILFSPKRMSLTLDSPSPSPLRRIQPRPSFDPNVGSPSPFFSPSPQPQMYASPVRRTSANLHHASIQLQPPMRSSPQSQLGMSPLPYVTTTHLTAAKAEVPPSPSPSDAGGAAASPASAVYLFQERIKYERTESAPAAVQSAPSNQKLQIEGVPFEDVLALKGFLASIDIKHFGFRRSGSIGEAEMTNPARSILGKLQQSNNVSQHVPPSPTLQSPQPIRIRVNRDKVRSYAMTSTSSDEQYEEEPRVTPSKRAKSATQSTSYDQLHGLLSPISSPYGASSSSRPQTPPKSPYRGKHSPNPQCASCGTTKTPYWRDAWGNGTMLCNACGLRYAKFKRRCLTCNYVPRKEDKGGRICPQCNGAWSQ